MKPTYLTIGLMSGTSMDGIDAAAILTDGKFLVKSIGASSLRYDREFHLLLKAAEYATYHCQGNLKQAHQHFSLFLLQFIHEKLGSDDPAKYLNDFTHYLQIKAGLNLTFDNIIHYSTLLHAEAVKTLMQKCNLTAKDVALIGYHGQTLYHQPNEKQSIQVGNADLLSELTHIPVISQFRQSDLRQGGQGAPLAPIYHQALAIRDNLLPCAVVNCGGIANVTFINSTQTHDLIGFDIGPGNVLIDQFVRFKTMGLEQMDQEGHYGLNGYVNEQILMQLYAQHKKFLTLKPPKSLDTHDLMLVPEIKKLTIQSGCATLAAFTAKTIAESVKFNIQPTITTWILCGGGWENGALTLKLHYYLSQLFPNVKLLKAHEIGWNNAALEAELMAYLAVRCHLDLPITFPTTTGVTVDFAQNVE